MPNFTLRKGLDIPVLGAPGRGIQDKATVGSVAVLGADYIGLKPRLAVSEGDVVAAGSPIMAHKDTPEVVIASPVSGRIREINRGERRVLISVVIDVDDTAADPVDFSSVGDTSTAKGLRERLCASGLWTSFRTRPYSKVPVADATPAAIFVTATDSEPLAADPAEIISDDPDSFHTGLEAIVSLTEGKTYLCQDVGADIPGGDLPGVTVAGFSGPHPAGLAGTHIHFLEPLAADRTVWTIGYQDVMSIGRLLLTGHHDASRVVALTGPLCANPRLVRTVVGANMAELVAQDLPSGDVAVRMISGSILSGCMGEGVSGYLGRYARQITLIKEDHEQIPLG